MSTACIALLLVRSPPLAHHLLIYRVKQAPGRLYIRTYGFSVEGWGLASILTALFTSDEGGAEGEGMTGDDYFINAPVMNNLFNPLMMLWNVSFVFSTRFRDFASFFLGRGAISVQ